MNESERELVGQHWRNAALGEHASVAAFARFLLHLMKLAAPPELLLGAIRAMEDEVHHTRLSFGIAARLTGQALGPGELDVQEAVDSRDDIASIVQAAIVEGCINETVSARFAMVGAERTSDEEIRRVLLRIVDDESRHADLAWHFLAWALKKYPSLTPMAESILAGAITAESPEQEDEPAILELYGQLVASSRDAARKAVLRDTIAPRAALLGLRVPPLR
jgi:hypothetical protein